GAETIHAGEVTGVRIADCELWIANWIAGSSDLQSPALDRSLCVHHHSLLLAERGGGGRYPGDEVCSHSAGEPARQSREARAGDSNRLETSGSVGGCNGHHARRARRAVRVLAPAAR